MLQLQTRKFDICRVSKLLVKYKIKASISDQVITLDGEVSDELLDELCNGLTISNVQNFSSEVFPLTLNESDLPKSDDIVSSSTKGESVVKETSSHVALIPQITEEYDLLYPTVKRGAVYWCDFGEPYGSEQGYIRYAIVVQNDIANFNSSTTIVLPCTTSHKKRFPVQYNFVFSNENMIDYDVIRVGTKENVVEAGQIRTIDKTRLRKFLGTMTPEFMNEMQDIIDISLNLQRKEKVITKTEKVYVDKPVYINVPADTNTPKERKDLNMVQIQLLSLVDVKELFKIAQTRYSDKIKAERILELFGFNMQKNGVKYLFKAILISPKDAYFNLETLCDSVAKSEHNVEKDEIKRLIVARIKEQFKFRKSPTIDFIRLVNSFLIKKEDEQNEENNI